MSSSIFISAGEASGEHYGALLLAALRRRLAAEGREAEFFGMGGARMESEGLVRIVRAEEMAVMGLTEVLLHLPHIWREFQKLKKALRQKRPAVAILIDFPGLHFRLLPYLHRLGIPVLYFVSPQLWAWKKHRIRLVQKYVDRMLVIFPFEEPYYRQRGVQAEFVGHPLAELAPPSIDREAFAAAHGLDPAKTWIGLLPGSRAKEIGDLLPEMLRAAQELNAQLGNWTADKNSALGELALRDSALGARESQDSALKDSALKGHGFSRAIEEFNMNPALAAEGKPEVERTYPQGLKPDLLSGDSAARLKPCPFKTSDADESAKPEASGFEFLLPLAPTLNPAQRVETRRLTEQYGGDLSIHLVDEARAALHHARASIVASGTATLEAALIGNPFVVVYRVSRLTYAIAKRLVKVPHVAMVNLIADQRIVPELIQDDFTAANIVQQMGLLLSDGPARPTMMEELARIRALLHTGKTDGSAIERVAEVALELIANQSISAS